MAIREYIGARYVPRFRDTYDVTQSYEALDVVDNGLGTSYIAKVPTPAGTPLTNTDYWALYGASSGAIVNLQNQIDAIRNDIAITPDQVSTATTDYQKLQDAVYYALNNKVDIYLNRDYDITGHTIDYPKDADGSGNTRFKTCIFGGGIIKTDSGLMFEGNDNASDNYFFNVRFSGGINTYVLNSKIIRTFFAFCQFEGLKSLYEISAVDSYIQSLKMEQCTATGMSDYFIQCNGAYDITIDSCNFEKGFGAFKTYASGYHGRLSGVTISNCCLESLQHAIMLTGNCLDIALINDYFEGNTIDNIKISGSNENITINGCGLYGSVTGVCEDLVYIDATTITRPLIMECFTENGRIINCTTSIRINAIRNRSNLAEVGSIYDPFYRAHYSVSDITDIHNNVTFDSASFSILGGLCTMFLSGAITANLSNNDIIAKLPIKPARNVYLYGYTTAYNSDPYHAYIDTNGNLKQYGGNGGQTYNNLIIAGAFELA